jgi:hypothetical protein
MRRKQKYLLPLLVLAVLGACTYEAEIQKSEEYSLPVLSPDGTRYAYLYHIMRYRQPSGISTFPDGGIPLYLEDRIVLMLCDATGREGGGGPSRERNCSRTRAVQELPFKYKPRLGHMSIRHTRLQWITPHRIAYDLQSSSLVSDKGESEVPGP